MISAIIPYRDWSLERLGGCVERLRHLPAITEIIVVDFGSSEPLAALPGCRVVRVDADRWCLAEANNIGIAEARNDVVLKIDADVRLMIGNETLEELAGSLSDGRASFIVLQPTDVQYEDGRPSRRRLRPSWAEGCCNLFSRADVVEIGGFDTRYFDYGGEDNDLCQRLRRYGKRVDLFQSDRVLHERHPPSDAREKGVFSDLHKKNLLADTSIFRPQPFRYSDYRDDGTFGPAITVAIATTDRPNRAAHLDYCLRGLAAQTFRDFEVRICENGTPARKRLKLAALRKAFPTLDIHLHVLDEPSIPKARNLITDHARGFYIAVHDDDDFSFPTRFEEQLDCMAAQEGAHGCHSSWIEFDEETGRLRSYYGQPRDINELLRRPRKVTLHSSCFYRRDVLARMRYDETLTLGSDYQLHVRMTLAGLEVPHSGRFHVLRRLHGASVTNTGVIDQRDVADRTNAAYRYFLGEPFLAAIRAESEDPFWVTGFPTIREMLAYLPADFGAFRLDLHMEAALALGFDPLFGAGGDGAVCQFAGVTFVPAYRDYGYSTRLVMRSQVPMTAGEMMERLPAFGALRGVDPVSEIELSSPSSLQGLDALRVEAGQRRVMSRRYDDMVEALNAMPESLLAAGLGRIEFFAVNHPVEGVHVLLGTFDNTGDLEYALSVANSGRTGDYFAVSSMGRRGGFHGA
ncbi:glycosyltransferase [Rhodobacterales bacterium HKCCE3408]|nr:glycosyltransferase [Rhodobacterales bacterium HKCCE3408]